MNTDLSEKKCVACESGEGKLAPAEIDDYRRQLKRGWRLVDTKRLEREFKFPDFKHALDFTNQVGQIAEEQGHHPDFYLSWGKVKLSLWTHSAGGLTENDFILASKIDLISRS